MTKLIYLWIISATVFTLAVGFMYVMVQQNYRQSANDPQIQMAEEAAGLLFQGKSPIDVIPSSQVDIATSLTPYVVLYNDAGAPVAGSGLLNNELPTLPNGVFQYALTHNQDRITWQPQNQVRQAIIVVHYGGDNPGYVMAGRSLREVENREATLTRMLGAGWLVGLLILALEFVGLGTLELLPTHRRH